MYSIGEVSSATGMSRHTLRLYEDEGFFVNPVRRDARGDRIYDDDDLEWLHRVAVLRRVGMPIAEIAEYVRLIRAEASDELRIRLLERHRRRVADDLDDARERLALLDGKLDDYRSRLDAGLRGPPWSEAAPRR